MSRVRPANAEELTVEAKAELEEARRLAWKLRDRFFQAGKMQEGLDVTDILIKVNNAYGCLFKES